MRKLSSFEKNLMRSIIDRSTQRLTISDAQIESLRVERVDVTGVGAYVVFDQVSQSIEISLQDAEVFFEGHINIEGVSRGLGALLLIDEGKYYHIELLTYGELWNGDTETDDFQIELD